MHAKETIASIATPPGIGGVGIVRVSGNRVPSIIAELIDKFPEPRYASFTRFKGKDNEVIDEGISLYFPAPHSFTGEDVLECQCHGGPVILDRLLSRLFELGARPARPGEFSERAFLNGKIDLIQAEAIADLIETSTESSARLAVRTLQGEFSRRVKNLVNRLIELRAFVEASVDFPEEEIDFISDPVLSTGLRDLQIDLEKVRSSARQGQLLRDGMTIVIAGLPNAGKSSLLNALAGYDSAIVTHLPGTTRDILKERIQIDGLPLHVIDTAGLRQDADLIEQEGIRRAREQIERADRVLWIVDDTDDSERDLLVRQDIPPHIPLTVVRNKIDCTQRASGLIRIAPAPELAISAKTGDGIEDLRTHLKECVGYNEFSEGEFMARRRHLVALERSACHITKAAQVLRDMAAGEVVAEELRLAQNNLSELTGEFLPDDLLGEIFGRFCIGK